MNGADHSAPSNLYSSRSAPEVRCAHKGTDSESLRQCIGLAHSLGRMFVNYAENELTPHECAAEPAVSIR